MKKFPNCIQKLFYEPLVITPAKHAALCRVLEARMGGQPNASMMDDEEGDDEDDFGYGAYGTDAVIPVHGVLTNHASDIPASSCGCGLDRVSAMVVFEFNTPGGGVTGIPELASKIAAITTKETVGFTDSECCSGGIWLGMQCQTFYATPSASVGSIGVWCAYLDISKQMKKAGENMQAISAGKFKLLGAYWKPLSDEEKAMVQTGVDKIYAQFKDAVLTRREVPDAAMQGQIFDGQEACEAGLCDGLVSGLDEILS